MPLQDLLAVIFFHSLLSLQGDYGRIEQQACLVLLAVSRDTRCQNPGEGFAAGEQFLCNAEFFCMIFDYMSVLHQTCCTVCVLCLTCTHVSQIHALCVTPCNA